MRGYLVRRDARSLRSWLLFRRLTEKAEERSRELVVGQLIRALRLAHQGNKEQKQTLLNGYITYCAVRIQKAWRGHYDRKFLLPFITKIGGAAGLQRLEASIDGWRVRRIMNLKEVKGRAQLIKDHEGARQLGQFTDEELAESRRNSVKKFIGLVDSMQINGQWIILLRSHFVPRSSSYKIPRNSEEEK